MVDTRKRGVSVRALAIVMLVLATALSVGSLLAGRRAAGCVDAQTKILTAQRESMALAQTVSDTADYLTEQVAFFAVTCDPDYMFRYWKEVDETQSQAKALTALEEMGMTRTELDMALSASEAARRLTVQETWAMRLIADGIGMDPAEMPAKVAAVTYEQGEAALDQTQKLHLAVNHLFGEAYTAEKQAVRDGMARFQDLLMERKQGELDAAMADTRSAQRTAAVLDRCLLLMLVGFVAVFFLMVLRPLRRYAAALEQMGPSKWERLRPAGSRESKLFADTFNRIYARFVDNEQALEKERFRFRLAVENTPVIIFEYEFATDTYSSYGDLEATNVDPTPPTERLIPRFRAEHLTELVDGRDLELAQGFFHCKAFRSADMRVRPYLGSDRTLWARATATPILDGQGRPVRLIGKLSSIQSEREKELALADLKMRDSLTGLYTREAGTRLAREYMARRPEGEVCGIFLLDMDDFEQINREEGGAFADAILRETARILRTMTGPDDYQIRLGGDEFMLFLKNCNKARATVLGPSIAKEIQTLSGGGDVGRRITVSMGMCVTEVTEDYDALYHCAESTLKFVKANRRGTAACYLDTSNELGDLLTNLYPDGHDINSIDHTAEKPGELISDALELLEKSKNLDDAVYLLLARAGRSGGLMRVSIAEVDPRYLTCRYLYQWTADQSARQGTNVYYLKPEDLSRLIQSYDKEGFCDCYSVRPPREMGSVLHTAIWDQGNYVGFMSFETEAPGHSWTEEERRLLRELSNVITSFVLKAKADSISYAKTEFLSRMSHEIRTPMNAISGMTEIALKVLDDREKVRDCLTKIKSSNYYLLGLINDILDMSRIESGKMELSPEAALPERKMDELVQMLGPQFEQKGVRLTAVRRFAPDRPILADFLRLDQVLINLLGNALKFTPAGGDVTLTVEQAGQTDTERTLRFSVADTGIGIPPESLGRIFNAFEQADKGTTAAYGGTGLGLSISSKLIQLMGGRLAVESEVDKGSDFSFTLTFPVAELAEVQEQSAGEEGSGDFAQGRRLLLVEDNELNREIAETILTMRGFQVENAENGKVAVERFAGRPAHYYDAILMDIRMPVMDGLEATRQIRLLEREDSRTVPIIAMTANAFDEDMRKSIESGMDGHLSKPLDIDKLFQVLRGALSRGPSAGASAPPIER